MAAITAADSPQLRRLLRRHNEKTPRIIADCGVSSAPDRTRLDQHNNQPDNGLENLCSKGGAKSAALSPTVQTDSQLADLLAIWPRLTASDREQVVRMARLMADAEEARGDD